MPPPRRRNRDPKTGLYLSKLTDETKAAILEALASGVPPEVAAAYAGVARSTYNDWLSRGRSAIASANGNLAKVLTTDEYAQFAMEVEETLAVFVVGNMAHVTSAGTSKTDGQWQALAWQLERRFPHWFGHKTQVGGTVHHKHEHAHVVVAIPQGAWEQLPVDDRLKLAEILGKVEGSVQEGDSDMLALNP